MHAVAPSSTSSARWAWALAFALAGPAALLVHQGSLIRMPTAQDDALGAIVEVHQTIARRHVEPSDPQALRDGALRGMTSTLDRFSEYISPEDLAQFEEDTSGQFGGIGIYVNVEGGKIVVIAPIEDTPAWTGGVLPGDIVVLIDDQEYSFATTSDAVTALKGAPGSKVALTLRRPDEQVTRRVELERAVIQVKSVKGARLVDPAAGIGYVRVTSFNSGTSDAFAAAAEDLAGQGLKALVLDLRGNPGGYLAAAADVADVFLEDGRVIVETRGRLPTDREVEHATEDRRLSVPVALLIDGGSASASEILAGALRDNGVATLVGTRSYGKGSVQSLISIQGGRAQLKLTTQYYFTPSGRRIHRGDLPPEDRSWGLLPDVTIRIDAEERQRLATAESERDMARLKARASDRPDPSGPRLAPVATPDRLAIDDPQVRVAVAHLAAVLAGTAKVGPQPGGVAGVDSAGVARVDSTHEEDVPGPYGE